MVEAIDNQEGIKGQIEINLNNYLEGIRGLGIVSGVVIGLKEGEKSGYVWNIFIKDFSIDYNAIQPPFVKLSQLVYEFDKSMEGICPMRMSNVSPSNLEELKERCKKQDIDIEIISFNDEKTAIEEAI